MYKDSAGTSEVGTEDFGRAGSILHYLVSFCVGAVALSLFSLVQKSVLGIPDIFAWRGFVIPVAVGGAVGLVLMHLYSRVLKNNGHLQKSRAVLQDFLDNASDLIQSVDAQGRYTYVNTAWRETLKYDLADLKDLTVFDVIRPDYRPHCHSIFQRIMRGEQLNNVETVFIAKDGSHVHVIGNLNCRMEDGVPVSTRGIFRDITSEHQALEQGRLAAKVFDSAQEAIVVTDRSGLILAVNPAFGKITGYTAGEAIGRVIYDLLSPPGGQPPDYQDPLAPRHHQMNWDGEMLGRRKNGETFAMRSAVSVIQDEDGQTAHYVGIFSDVTDHKRMEKRLEHLANYDFLTDLPNRAMFQKKLDEAVAIAERDAASLAVLFLDLDVFKSVNDRFGHEVGDQLMQNLARRVKDCAGDPLVARMGGDEFAIILERIADVSEAEALAQRIINSMGNPFTIMNEQIEATFSIGISTYPRSRDSRALLIDSDHAMYQAKQSGRNTYRVF